jgi:signal transduction histidine kinase
VRTTVTDSQLEPSLESERVAEAHARAQERLHRQRATLRPLGWAVILVVVLGSANSHPVPGLHGKALAVTLALCVFAATLLVAIRDRFAERSLELQAAAIAVMGAAGVTIAGLQLKGATGVAAGVAVFIAITRLPLGVGVAIGGAVTIALAAVTAIAGSSASAVAAGTLVTVLLGVVAQFLKQSRQSQDQAELLLAQLQDARDEQARAAAIAERGRIASELHDVLAHSLSGAAIQLQGARKLADREHATPSLSDAIDRASELVKGGLANARQAVGALRGDALPTIAQLPSLIDSYRTDMNLDVTLRIDGGARTLAADPSLALYRGAQEALTNVSRYAPSACTTVVLCYEHGRTRLSVNNGPSATPPATEWAVAADWTACMSGSSGPAARCRPGRQPTAGGSRSRCQRDDPRPDRRRPAGRPRRTRDAARPARRRRDRRHRS